MKVVHVNATEGRGGAALACRRLSNALCALGVESEVLLDRLPDEDAWRVDLIQRRYVWGNRTPVSDTHFSLALSGHDLSSHPAVRAADVVHLHWVATTQTPASLSRLLGLEKPVVWTLHDQAPFTGGCHYTAGCTEFRRDCAACPQLRDDPEGLTSAVLRDKAELLASPNLTLVAPSSWMASQVRSSKVFDSKQRIEVIPNGVDLRVYRPRSKDDARRSLGIPVDATYVLCSSQSEKRKGGESLIAVLMDAFADPRLAGASPTLLCVGEAPLALVAAGAPVAAVGLVHNDDVMAAAYAAADVFVFPSLEDNLPNMVLEAIACGTPVVAYGVGGVAEAVRDQVNGRIVPAGDAPALADALAAILSDRDRGTAMGSHGRDVALESYDVETQARRLRDLYDDLISGASIQASAPARLPEPGPETAPLVERLTALCLREEVKELQREVQAHERRLMLQARARTHVVPDDAAAQIRELEAQLAAAEEDRAARLVVIDDLKEHLERAEQAAAERLVALELVDAERRRLAVEVGRVPDRVRALRRRTETFRRRGIAGLRRATRFDHWWYAKIPPLLGLAFLLNGSAGDPSARALVPLLSMVVSIAAVAAYGHVINDVFDVESDRRAGKQNAMASRSRGTRTALAAFLALASVTPALFGEYSWTSVGLLLVNLLLPTLYSVPPVRLKERGALALACDAAGSHVTPTLFVLSIFPLDHRPQLALAATMLAWSSALGLKGILHHQIADRQHDVASDTVTFATSRREGQIERWLARYNLWLELPLSGLLAIEVARSLPLVAVALFAYTALESAKHRLGYEFAVTADLRDRRPSVPFANEAFYVTWLPFAAALQLAADAPAWLWAPLAVIALFLPTYRAQVAELRTVARALHQRARGAARAA